MKSRAVVIGGGMGGIVTAEVLSKHFSEVVLLERDQPQSLWEQNAVAMAGVRVCEHHAVFGSRPAITCWHLNIALPRHLASSLFSGRPLGC